ncbi:MAG: NADH-quinone oxidoreductase subunit NuoK [Phycisphaerales bacterium]|nr:NADH-quinone oxidoreductase subunit NuoK [Phycisphaerales bacterium]
MLTAYLLVGAALFVLGLIGFVTRRNLIVIFLCTEMMFQGIILNLIGFGRYPLGGGTPLFEGQAFALFLIAVAAAEAALALAFVTLLFRNKATLDAGALRMLREE